jgi:hypothetical protein
MGKYIRLHPQKGLNPRMTFCPRCGKDGDELILLGLNDGVYSCEFCGQKHIGRPTGGKCQQCGRRQSWKRERTVEEHERIPGSLCGPCKNEAAEHARIVAEGGVYWACKDCHAQGVIKSSPFAERVRKALSIQAPRPCGVTFSKDQGCPKCGAEVT